jgi:hypothetical protein
MGISRTFSWFYGVKKLSKRASALMEVLLVTVKSGR